MSQLEARRRDAASCAVVKVLIDPPCAAIAAVLTEMDVHPAVREQRQATTRALKQSMMQKHRLLNGRPRRVGPHAPIP